MGHREYEPPANLQEPAQPRQQRLDSGHVHQRHRTHRSVEASLSQCEQLLAARRVEHAILDAVGLFGGACPRVLNHLRCHVGGQDPCSETGHLTRELPVTTGNIQHKLVLLQHQQALLRRSDQQSVPLVALAHPLIPERGVPVPDVPGPLD